MPLASPAPEEIHPVAVPSAQKPWGDTAASRCTHLLSPQILFHPPICFTCAIQAAIQQVLTHPACLTTSVPVPWHITMTRHLTHLASSLVPSQVSSF